MLPTRMTSVGNNNKFSLQFPLTPINELLRVAFVTVWAMNLRPEHVNAHTLVDNFSIPPGRQAASDLV